jgi:cobalt/nickel transport system permease protein
LNSLSGILNIREKLIIILINIFFIVSVGKGQYLILSLYFLVVIIILLLFKPDWKKLIRRVPLVFLYPFLISIFIPFLSEGREILKIDFKLFALTVTDNGLAVFFTVLIKSFLCILLVASLLLSSDEIELLGGLRRIYLPSIIVSIIYLMYRYTFLIVEESRTGQMAIKSRVFKRYSYGTINKKLVHLMSNLFIKSVDRAENIYKSMESRGFNGSFYIMESKKKMKVSNIIILLFFILLPVLLKTIELLDIM